MTDTKLRFEPVTLESKELFDSYFQKERIFNSDFTFTNIFMWRKSYNIRYAVIDGMLCISSRHGGEPRAVNFPLGSGNIRTVIQKIIDDFESCGETPLIRLYSEEARKLFEDSFPDGFVITEDRNSFDYVYRTADLIELSGKKYHGKRNHVNKFKSEYNWEYWHMTPDFGSRCMDMFSKWYSDKRDSVPGIDEQLEAVSELISNWERLDITGGCLTVDSEMVAFSFGEPLCRANSVAVIHLEHANTDFKGSYAAMNREFLKHEWSSFEFVNREEDMGLDGLRRAKRSYKPAYMTKKYTAKKL